jgi:hypothetical protein
MNVKLTFLNGDL